MVRELATVACIWQRLKGRQENLKDIRWEKGKVSETFRYDWRFGGRLTRSRASEVTGQGDMWLCLVGPVLEASGWGETFEKLAATKS